MYTWHPELPEWLVLLYGIIVVVDVLRVVHHVQQKLVLRAAVVDVLIVLDGKPLTRNIRKMNFLPIQRVTNRMIVSSTILGFVHLKYLQTKNQ